MFESISPAPPDPILGITEAFNQDPRAGKVNLSVGLYKDAAGSTPVLPSVKEAERRLLDAEKSKGYKPIHGDPAYGRVVRALLFGEDSAQVDSGTVATCHTPGGTGALRLAADFLGAKAGVRRIWVSDPTWANHSAIFSAAGLEVSKYRYFDAAANALDWGGMKASLEGVGAGEVVLLHACCHNPSGVDPSEDQWREIASLLAARNAIPLVDFAYQGFAAGLEPDAVGLRILASESDELLVCSSFSKNFGLYCERTGALSIGARNAQQCAAALSQLKACARANFSNPPAHGGSIVTTIVEDAELRQQWEGELSEMRQRIAAMRRAFVAGLKAAGAKRDFGFIAQQKGMFSFSGLNAAQVAALREKHAVYIVGSGRINVAGMTEANLPGLCQAIVSVL